MATDNSGLDSMAVLGFAIMELLIQKKKTEMALEEAQTELAKSQKNVVVLERKPEGSQDAD